MCLSSSANRKNATNSRQIGSSPATDHTYGIKFLNRLNIFRKRNTVKDLPDTRPLDYNTDQFSQVWLIER